MLQWAQTGAPGKVGLRSRASSESDDKVKMLFGEFLPGICHRAGGIYFEVFAENLQDQGVDFASRNFSSAVNFKAVAAH